MKSQANARLGEAPLLSFSLYAFSLKVCFLFFRKSFGVEHWARCNICAAGLWGRRAYTWVFSSCYGYIDLWKITNKMVNECNCYYCVHATICRTIVCGNHLLMIWSANIRRWLPTIISTKQFQKNNQNVTTLLKAIFVRIFLHLNRA